MLSIEIARPIVQEALSAHVAMAASGEAPSVGMSTASLNSSTNAPPSSRLKLPWNMLRYLVVEVR